MGRHHFVAEAGFAAEDFRSYTHSGHRVAHQVVEMFAEDPEAVDLGEAAAGRSPVEGIAVGLVAGASAAQSLTGFAKMWFALEEVKRTDTCRGCSLLGAVVLQFGHKDQLWIVVGMGRMRFVGLHRMMSTEDLPIGDALIAGVVTLGPDFGR